MPLAFIDTELEELALLLFTPIEGASRTFRHDLLSAGSFDFSVSSLKALDAYLLRVRKHPSVKADWNRTVLRAGAYVGEVVRRALPPGTFHWVAYNVAASLDASIAAFGYGAATAALLYRPPSSFAFPLAKVEKCLSFGVGDNTEAFARVIISDASEALATGAV